MKHTTKLAKAKAKLLIEHPALGHIISRMHFSPNDDIQNFISDGKRFEYNDEFIENASKSDLEFALSHAALHHILKHTDRKAKRATYLWQLATDYTVSSLLKQSGFALPDFARYQSRFDGMYAEEVYAILKEEIKNEEFSDDEELKSGFNEENKRQQRQNNQRPTAKEDSEKLQMETELEERLAQKFVEEMLERFSDDLPEAIKRYVDIRPASKIDWKRELRHVLQHFAKEDYTLYPASKKLLYEGIYLPSLHSQKLHLTIAVDSSGSIDQTLLNRFLSEIAYILLSISSYEIDFIVADDTIREHIKLQKGDPFPPEYITGGCGTDFRVVFEYIHKHSIKPNLLLFFTDLEGFFPKEPPNYNVVWVTTSHKVPTFGRKIVLK